jgi:hypothetical protein
MDHSTRRFIGITRQFISLSRKLKKELRKALSDLTCALQKQTEAIRQSNESRDDKQSPTPEIITTVNLPESIEVHQKAEDTSDERAYRRATFFVTGLTFGAITVYAVLVYWQYEQMIASNRVAQTAIELSKASSRLDERAWVGVQGAVLNITPKRLITVNVDFTNSGRTPAVNAYMRNSAGPKLGDVLQLCKDAIEKKESRILIPPGAHSVVSHPITKQPLPEHLEQTVNPKQNIYAFGCVVYDDIFTDKNWEHRHWLTHCEVINTDKIESGVVALGMLACKDGNDTGDGAPPSPNKP